jgi:hypothetical protein
MKRVLRIAGAFLLTIFLLAVYNLFFANKRPMPYQGMGGGVGMPESFSNELSDSSVSSMMPSLRSSSKEVAVDSFAQPAFVGNQTLSETEKKVIKIGDLSINVESADKASEEIGKIAKSNGGDVFSVNFYEATKGYKNGNIVVKVPNANFEKTFAEIKKVATHVSSESVSGQDVTEEYADLEIQIRNKKVEEESFLNVLKQAVKIDDILSATREVSRVRGEIESLEGRKKFMNSQIDMSSINIQISEDISLPAGEGWRPWEVVKSSVKELVGNLQGFVDNTVNFFIVVLPTLILYGIIILVVYKVGRKIYEKLFKRQ